MPSGVRHFTARQLGIRDITVLAEYGIYYPAKKGDDEPENILKIVKEWRRSQGLPLFKDSE
ncbi:TPA: bacteriocin immunity protein [Escherichia coli]|nr:bacteriocin immunity protein [Escherichia coli]